MSEKPVKPSRKRRWLIVTAVVAVLAAGWLTYEILLSPSAAIRQAEAFLFRRMTVVQLDEGQYRSFYVSNRRLEPGDESIALHIGDVLYGTSRKHASSSSQPVQAIPISRRTRPPRCAP